MNYKIGQDLYHLGIQDDGKCTLDTYRVRTIRGGKVYAVLFDPCTWGKESSRQGWELIKWKKTVHANILNQKEIKENDKMDIINLVCIIW